MQQRDQILFQMPLEREQMYLTTIWEKNNELTKVILENKQLKEQLAQIKPQVETE